MTLKMTVGAVVFALSMPVLAQSAPKVPPSAGVKLSCPTGSRQVGGPKSALEASVCVRTGRDGSRTFHGPYVAYWQNGVKQAEGQFDEGFREGKWTFFDEKGVKTGETFFKMGNYHGLRVEFWANGQKKLEENYASGRRQGVQKMFDQAGKVLSQTEFGDDRPLTTR